MTCPACHTPALPGDSFCRHCGGGLAGLPDAETRAEDMAVAADLQRACRLMDEGSHERAIELLEAIPESSACRAAAESLLAAAHDLAGRPEQAARHLEAALQLNPDDQSVRERLQSMRGGKRVARLTALEAGLWFAGASCLLVFVVGWLLLHNGRQQESRAVHTPPGGVLDAATGGAVPPVLSAEGVVKPMEQTPSGAAPAPVAVAAPVGAPAPDPRFQREFTFPQRRPDTGPGGPPIRIGLPPVRDSAVSRQGLGAAAIGEVVPLPAEPAIAPAGATMPGAPAPLARVDTGEETGELDAPESGLIRIRPLGGSAPPEAGGRKGPMADPKIRIEVIGGQSGRG